MFKFIGVAFLQSLKWAMLFITSERRTFTFKIKTALRASTLDRGDTAIYGLGTGYWSI